MKITLDFDCTPEEARRFFGLPDVAPLQDAVLKRIEQQWLDATTAVSPATLMRLWMPMAPTSPEAFQRAMADFFRPLPVSTAGAETRRQTPREGNGPRR